MRKWLVLLAVSLHTQLGAQPICSPASDVTEVRVQSREVLRAGAPKALFGFDLPWYDAQIAYLRKGAFRPEMIEWFRPFEGAVYRYPAGSNSFEWRKAVGGLSRRSLVGDLFLPKGEAVVELGPAEFLQFMGQVGGQSLWMLNLVGPKGREYSDREVLQESRDYIRWIQANAPGLCGSTANCRAHAYELGNELDWPSISWPAERYVARAKPVAEQIRQLDPSAKLLVLGKTAPWDANSRKPEWQGFDATVAHSLAGLSDGVTIHPYYDGLPITAMEEYIDKLGALYRRHNPKHQVYVTEHARWPSIPAVGRWESNWYQASGSQGGVSTADFLLAMMGRPHVAAAMWHALGTRGPWQLIKWDSLNDTLYPSPTYWAMRVLRDAMLDDVVRVEPSLIKGGSYSGGYGARISAMSERQGQKISLMMVNRTSQPLRLRPSVDGRPLALSGAVVRQLVADEAGSDNTDQSKQRFVMHQPAAEQSVVGGALCVPPRSVLSVVLEGKAP